MNKWLIVEKEYKGDAPYVGHVDTKEVMQGMGKEIANLSPVNEQNLCWLEDMWFLV